MILLFNANVQSLQNTMATQRLPGCFVLFLHAKPTPSTELLQYVYTHIK